MLSAIRALSSALGTPDINDAKWWLVSYDVPAFEKAVGAFAPDLLHAHFAKDATTKAWEIASRTGIPFTFTAHGYDIFRKPPPDFLERAMAALSPPERAALTLAYRDGASHAEVASILGCPLGTAKTHILRGKEKLARQLRAWGR